MTSRSTKRKRNAKYAEQARYMRHVERIVQKLGPDLAKLAPPIVRTKFLGPFGGAPEKFDFSFVFKSGSDARSGERSGTVERATQIVLAALRRDGYPPDALTTFRFEAVSEQQIKDAGGDWDFDRGR